MDQSELKDLIAKVNEGIATDEDLAVYNACMNRIAPGDTPWNIQNMGEPEAVKQELWEKMQENIQFGKPVRTIRLWPRIAAAASIILCCSAAIYFYEHGKHQPATGAVAQNIIKPGTNGAILTLSNGKKIILESAKNGKLAQQNGSQVNKAGDSLLVYQPTTATAAIAYNTLETPKGRQVEVVLPDGSEVWLNAASSLKYPTAFTGKERLVELTGEADFKVTPNAKMPFRVKTNGQITEDIGTEFDIDAYTDEAALKTTLIEGSIKVVLNNRAIILKPGDQAVLKEDNFHIVKVDTDDVLAWKNGYFQFADEPLESIMRKISRWYDVEVTYQDNSLKSLPFHGTISKYSKVSQVLKKLELTGAPVHFKIENKTILVTK